MTAQEYKPDLEAVIFDFQVDCEVNRPEPIKATLEKWVKWFPQFEKELTEHFKYWRLMVKASRRRRNQNRSSINS